MTRIEILIAEAILISDLRRKINGPSIRYGIHGAGNPAIRPPARFPQ